MDLLSAHRSAMRQFDDRVAAIRGDQWDLPTPDADWIVRDLVDHLVTEQLWVPALLAGRSLDEVTRSATFDPRGGNLGDDPKAAWTNAAQAARDAWTAAGALTRTVQLSSGPSPADVYCREMTFDLVVHAWDLARAIGAEQEMPNDLVAEALEMAKQTVPHYADTGIFAAPIPVPGCTDDLTELLALTGRNRWWRP